MKNVLALLLAVAMMSSLSLTAMAAAVEEPQPQAAAQEQVSDSPVNGLVIGADENGLELKEDVLLTPGETYRFPLSVTREDGTSEAVTDDLLDLYRINVSNNRSSIFEEVKMEKRSGEYFLTVKTEAGWPTYLTDATIRVRLLDRESSKELANMEIDLQVGYAQMDDDYIEALGQGESILVDPAAPVITEEQFETITKVNNYKAATFNYGDWSFEVRTNGAGTMNLVSNSNMIDDIMVKYEDNQFKFVTFPAGPSFRYDATVTIDVSNEAVDFDDTFYLYRYNGRELIPMDAQYNQDEGTLVFETKDLGRFVITDKRISDTTVIESGVASDRVEEDDVSSGSGNVSNPDTGANDAVGVAVALGAASLVAAAAVSLKKSR